VDEIMRLQKVVGKINILIEKIDWRKKELRSNEIDIAHQHLKKALQGFEESLQFQQTGGKEN